LQVLANTRIVAEAGGREEGRGGGEVLGRALPGLPAMERGEEGGKEEEVGEERPMGLREDEPTWI